MMGRQASGQERLFCSFSLEDHVPQDHLLRGINRCFDLGDLRSRLAPFYSHTGRPSIDPELMLRMLIVGHCFGIRSERRLCEEVHLNPAYRWFCRLDLADAVPDHSTFSKNRHGRFRKSDALRHVFESVLRRCMSEGLVRGEGFAIDASVIKADASRAPGVPGTDSTHWRKDEASSRAVREYLDALEHFNPTQDEHAEPPQPPAPGKNVSLTDPAACWTGAPGGSAFYVYSTNYLIDLDGGIIVDVEATPAHRTREVESAKTMVHRVEQRFGMKPDRLVGDTAYGTAAMLGWMVQDKGIAPHVPVWDGSERNDGTLSSSEFVWDEPTNEYRCPQGHALLSDRRQFTKPRDRITQAGTILYSAGQHGCIGCPMKPQCCPKMPNRRIMRSVHERSRDVARDIAATPQYKQSRRDRKKVEMLFAHRKRILKLDRLRLRGLTGAHDEFLLAATVQNLRRMAKRWFEGRQSAAAMPA